MVSFHFSICTRKDAVSKLNVLFGGSLFKTPGALKKADIGMSDMVKSD